MTFELEVCIDNLESLPLAIQGGATRIELCSSLALGGLTPSYGFMRHAAMLSSVPVYAMIRPRQGDFLFSPLEVDCMLEDIRAAKRAGLAGIVIGALSAEGEIDKALCQRLVDEAGELGVTFHRAIDQTCDYQQALETIIELGCERVLTSGLASSAEQGIEVIKKMVTQAQGRIGIMAGAGVSPANAAAIAQTTGIRELHLSGKSTRPSKMRFVSSEAQMGNNDLDDFIVPVTNPATIQAVATALSL